ncbi:MAG: cobalt ECF transporter T component CbiQ [Thermoleophilia bacterium]
MSGSRLSHRLLHALQPHHDVALADRGAWQATRLGNADVRVKVLLVCGAIVLNLLSDDWRTSATVIGMVVGAVLLDRGPSWHGFTSLAIRFIPGIVIVIPLVVLRALMGPRPYAAVLRVGPLAAAISTPGLEAGVLLAWKVVAGLALAVLLMTTTPVPHLLAALHWFRVPGIVVEVASLIYRYLFLLAEEGERLRHAQRLRRCRMRLGHRVADSSSLVGNLFIRAYDRAERVSDAQRMRGGHYAARDRPDLGRPAWVEAGVAAGALLLIAATLAL